MTCWDMAPAVYRRRSPRSMNMRAQLAALLDHLRIETAHVVGHSMGSLIALEFALCNSAAGGERGCA